MKKHTPGPWTYQPDNEEVIAPYVAWTGDIGGIPNEADGHLIAAAPDLLAALKRLLAEHEEWIKDEYSGTGLVERRMEHVNYARAAIARATGGKSL